MAQAAHKYMAGQAATVKAMSGTAWANAATRTMLGVRLGVDEAGDWSMVMTDRGPFRVGGSHSRRRPARRRRPSGSPARSCRRQLRGALFHRREAAPPHSRRRSRAETSHRFAPRRAARRRPARALFVRRWRPLSPAHGLPARYLGAGQARRPHRRDRFDARRRTGARPLSAGGRAAPGGRPLIRDDRRETTTMRVLGPIGDKILFENEV